MEGLDELAELVPPSGDGDDNSGARELVEAFLGFALPDEYVELSRRYGSGEFGLAAEGDEACFRLVGLRELLLVGPAWASVDRYFRDVHGERFAPRTGPGVVAAPVTRLDAGINADWPFWPEPLGAVPVGNSDGSLMYLLQHLDLAPWTVGWARHEWGVVETVAGPAAWLHGWLTGQHSLEGGPDTEPVPPRPEIRFRSRRHALVVADLEPSDATLADRTAKLAQRTELRSPLDSGLTDTTTGPTPLAYASAGWQRFDIEVPVGPTDCASCWYDDAVDGSGHHRVGALVPRQRPNRRDAIGIVADAVGSAILAVDEL